MVLFANVWEWTLLLMIPSTLVVLTPARTETGFLPPADPVSGSDKQPCPAFGAGGRAFFEPATYAEAVQCHNTDYFKNHGKPRPIHVLFEASAKTELGAAFGLMKALAAQKEKYKVTYLSPGGTIVRRGRRWPWPWSRLHGLTVLGPSKRPDATDRVLLDLAFPEKKNKELENAHINVVLKSALSSGRHSDEQKMALRRRGMEFSEISDGATSSDSCFQKISRKRANISGEEIWIQTLQSRLSEPVDFVVADCIEKPRSVKLLMGAAQVPGASWCGNITSIGEGLLHLVTAGVLPMINKQMAAKGTELQLRSHDLVPMFSAHFLGWGAEGEQPVDHVILEEKKALGPTREFTFKANQMALNQIKAEIEGPLIEFGMKIPISLVSDLPTAKVVDVHQERDPACGLAAREGGLPGDIKAICKKMDDVRGPKKEDKDRVIRLIYIAFGSQGFRFKKKAYQEIIDAAANVPDAVVFFVIPQAADWKGSPPYPYEEPETWHSDYYSDSVAGEALTLPKNVLLSTWADQPAILKHFGGPNTVFLTHGGAGSLSQGIANNVALACFPLWDDQPGNCGSVTNLGFGVDLRQFSGRMVLEETIENPGGKDLAELGVGNMIEVNKRSETPKAGDTIGKRIQSIFEESSKFQTALAKASDGLKKGAYAQDAVIEVFKGSMRKQLQLYKEMELFDFDAGMYTATREDADSIGSQVEEE